jgi:ATP/maltotriose-dependent transcriptional regulator MalT
VFCASGKFMEAKQMFEDCRQICVRTGNRSRLAEALSGLSEIMKIEGDAEGALQTATEAKGIFASTGEELKEANLNLQIAELLLDRGDSSGATTLAFQAMEVFAKTRSVGEQGAANLVMAKSLLKQGKTAEARDHADRAMAIGRKSGKRPLELAASIICAQARAASSSQVDRAEAAKALHQTIIEARKVGLVSEELEARLALAEMEFASGETACAHAYLLAVEKDATQLGSELISRKAAADLKRIAP